MSSKSKILLLFSAALLVLVHTTIGNRIPDENLPTITTTEQPVSPLKPNATSADSSSSEQESSEEEEDSSSSSDYYYFYSEEDPCPRTHFWHTRGRRCVPFKCPRANHLRDRTTGECLYKLGSDSELLKSFGNGGGGGSRSVFVTRNVLKPRNGRTSSGWQTVRQKKKIELQEDMANPVRTPNLING